MSKRNNMTRAQRIELDEPESESYFDSKDYKALRVALIATIAELESQGIPATARELKKTIPDQYLGDLLDEAVISGEVLAHGVEWRTYTVAPKATDKKTAATAHDWMSSFTLDGGRKARRPDAWGILA